ncbi:MAG: hypothetical protein UX88_C0005G0005 [Candidatus Woesebacteria bacterium GW2011_GWC2_47_16]|uniref:LytR/CpsA/Psr regulator C-terminal domain-containing protein n=8 Tax=Candidatus Woeseibacteriota TaxID=1752722 RepID=A0A0G1T5C3_9BACT|nr:MAG: hypothetical protein UX34_C0001G0006 [Candidatus Woesebacteria bacterium GW2011_GWF1_46_13]KKU49383.1 MAG: hypothetical protein UX67_C0001G0006 [Candidatus Woesebacteria bacterium GW2011_GWF2_46_8]KKU65195.1 MAG: hypothetical protein UX88_C0005G0005 [Candidatus Woesebacteria bacterium GW2011_GWC2_47_16]KKU71020.1 MAG: hypothetical protein UX95_C0006G0015 [Candidatus Woesebacteria bacterium GW2011_GWD1_47_21]OGM78668.1 MAG: hypothetical protein A2197_02090 [Candidatus Woesebacteria bacte
MTPAQRRKRRGRFKEKTGFGWFSYTVLFLAVLILGSVLAFKSLFWDGKAKVVSATATNEGEIVVSVFDPLGESITNIVVPGATQLKVSRQLGIFRAKSIWQLGENEGHGGKLLAETIVKNFNFPVNAWGEENLRGLANGQFPGILKSVLTPGKTNLKVGDRIKMAIFSLSVKSPKRVNIDLKEGNYLRKTRLVDGDEGYVILEAGIKRLLPFFSENGISQKNLRAAILDATGGAGGIVNEVGTTLEVMGLKVAAVSRKAASDTDCTFRTKDEDLAKKVLFVFSCSREKGEPEGNFDLEIMLGTSFAERY